MYHKKPNSRSTAVIEVFWLKGHTFYFSFSVFANTQCTKLQKTYTKFCAQNFVSRLVSGNKDLSQVTANLFPEPKRLRSFEITCILFKMVCTILSYLISPLTLPWTLYLFPFSSQVTMGCHRSLLVCRMHEEVWIHQNKP